MIRCKVILGLGLLLPVCLNGQTVETPVPDSLVVPRSIHLSAPEILPDESFLPPVNLRLPDLQQATMLNSEGIRIVPQNLVLESPFLSPMWYQSRQAIAGPFRYSYRNPIEGGDLVGAMGAYQVSDRFSVSGRAYMSSAYFGPLQPNRLTNGSIQFNANYWVTDWLMLYGHGQASVAPGMNPAYMSTIGGANYYGGGMQLKLTNKFGIGVGVTREYWMGKWQTNYQYYPVFY